MQEILIPSSLIFVCGSKEVDGDELDAAMSLQVCAWFRGIFDAMENPSKIFPLIEDDILLPILTEGTKTFPAAVCQWIQREEAPSAMFYLVYEVLCARLQASDDIDRISAIWSMLGNPLKYEFLLNYAMTVEEVFARTAQSIISTCGTSSLNLIGPNSGISFSRYRLPTWVPDFTRPFCDRFKHTSFLSKTQVDHHFLEDEGHGPILSVTGLQLDEVKSTSRIFHLKSKDPLNITQSLERTLLLRTQVGKPSLMHIVLI
jgi:hypothetical protein